LSEKEKEGKNVEPTRLQSRTEYAEKQSPSCSEEIVSWSMEYPGVAGERVSPGFRKDSAMRLLISSPKGKII
jgi:hypothetical protein